MKDTWRDFCYACLIMEPDGQKRLIMSPEDTFNHLIPSYPMCKWEGTQSMRSGGWTREDKIRNWESYVYIVGCSADDLAFFDKLVIHGSGYSAGTIKNSAAFFDGLKEVPFKEVEFDGVTPTIADMKVLASIPSIERAIFENLVISSSHASVWKGHENLKTLLLGASGVSDKGIVELVKSCPNLMDIGLDDTKVSRNVQIEVEQLVSERKEAYLERV